MNHLKNWLYCSVSQKVETNKCTSVQRQVIHAAVQRKVRISLVLIDFQTQRRGFCILQTHNPN